VAVYSDLNFNTKNKNTSCLQQPLLSITQRAKAKAKVAEGLLFVVFKLFYPVAFETAYSRGNSSGVYS